MRIHACLLCGEKRIFLNQERVWVVEDGFCFRKKVCFFLFCSYVFNRLLTWPTDQPRYASYKSYIMSNPWHPQSLFLSWLLTLWSFTFRSFTFRSSTVLHSSCGRFLFFITNLSISVLIEPFHKFCFSMSN